MRPRSEALKGVTGDAALEGLAVEAEPDGDAELDPGLVALPPVSTPLTSSYGYGLL